MKNSTLKIENNGTFIKFDGETSNGNSNKKIAHALVLRFFDWHDTMRSIGAKGFKANQPFKVTMLINDAVVWDTGRMNIEAQAKLKLINNPKGRAAFEGRLNTLVAYMGRASMDNIDQVTEMLEENLMSN